MDLRQQWDDLNIDRLLDMFVVSKMTGLEKPLAAEFEEFPLDGIDPSSSISQQQMMPDYLEEWSAASAQSSSGKVREGRIPPNSFIRGLEIKLLL